MVTWHHGPKGLSCADLLYVPSHSPHHYNCFIKGILSFLWSKDVHNACHNIWAQLNKWQVCHVGTTKSGRQLLSPAIDRNITSLSIVMESHNFQLLHWQSPAQGLRRQSAAAHEPTPGTPKSFHHPLVSSIMEYTVVPWPVWVEVQQTTTSSGQSS